VNTCVFLQVGRSGVRIYLQGVADGAVIHGDGGSPRIRVIAGDGSDKVVNDGSSGVALQSSAEIRYDV